MARPREKDHIPIGEGELGDWLGLDYRVEDRRWRGAYLSYLLKRAG